MLTNEQADESYQQAFAALHSVVIDPAATPEQQARAREKRDLLTLEFIGHAIASIEERTRQFRKFIGEMNAVIATFGTSSTIAGIRRLQEVVDAAGELIGLAVVPAAGAKTAANKTANKAVRKAAKTAPKTAPKRAAKNATKKAPKKATKKAAKKAAKRATKTATKTATKKAAKKAEKKAPKKLASKTAKRQARKAAKKPVKLAAKKPAKRAPGRRARPAKRGRWR